MLKPIRPIRRRKRGRPSTNQLKDLAIGLMPAGTWEASRPDPLANAFKLFRSGVFPHVPWDPALDR